MNMGTIFYYAIGLFLLYILGLILVWPIKKIIKLLINGVLGVIMLFVFNIIGSLFGLGIEINPLNAIIVGFLGIPGVALILILQLIFH